MNRKMVTIQAGELSLTGEESVGIAGLHDRWKTALESLPVILEYTGGWAAGFKIMLEYGDPGEEMNLLKREMARDFFFNYFAGEIFNKMEPDRQSFLLQTAHMPSFSSDAAMELTGFAGAGRVLADMNRQNYFTEKKIQDGIIYQFHPMFKEFLLSRAEEELDSGELAKLYRKAAEILVENGQLEDAFLLYGKSKDHAAQADLIRGHAQHLIGQRRLQLVEQWLRELPPEMITADPWLLFRYGQCCLPFNPPESRNFYIQAHNRFRKQDDTTGQILSVTGTIETILTEWGDFTQLDPWIAELDRLLKNTIAPPYGETEARAMVAMFSALMFRQPHHPDMKLWEGRTFELLRSDMGNSLRLLAGSYLSHYYYWIGDILQAGVVIDIMDELLKSVDLSPLDFMTVMMQKAVHGWFTADCKGCMEAVHQGLAAAEKSGVHLVDNWLLAQGVYAMLSLDDPGKATALLDRMKSVLNSQRSLDISHYYYLSSMYHLQKGDLELALRHSENSMRIARETGTPFPEGLNAITAAQICFETGDAAKAREFTLRAREIGREMHSHLLLMLSFLNKAYFSLKRGKQGCAEALHNALVMQREKGMINFPGWRTPFMTELYAEALNSGIEPDFVRDSIRRRNILPEESSTVMTDWPWRIRIYTLGHFETVIDGEPLRFRGKQQRKPLELLKAVIALGGRKIALTRLEGLLWPETEGDKARQALVTTLHRLRKLLRYEKALELSGTKLSLNNRYCWVDAGEMDQVSDKLREILADGRFDADKAARMTERMLALYRADFLKNEEEWPWVFPARARCRSRFLQAITTMARKWEQQGSFAQAVDLYRRGLEADEFAEEFYQGLMRCCQLQGRTAEGLAIYQRCREILSSSLGIAPSPETESLHLALRQGKARG
jgi:DNA-binding SARP family transcriptional activator